MTNLLLSVASIVTVICFTIVATGNLPTESDRTGLAAFFVFLTFPRWCSLAMVLKLLVEQGQFSWISSSTRIQTLSITITHILMGITTLALNIASHDPSMPEEFRFAALVMTFIIPLVAILYLTAAVNKSWTRIFTEDGLRKTACSAAGVCVLILFCLIFHAVNPKMASVHAGTQYEQRLSDLKALSGSDSVAPYLRFLYNQPGDIGTQARYQIVARPNLKTELMELLGGTEWVREALAYIRTEMPVPSDDLAPAAAEGIRGLTEIIRGQLARNADSPEGQFVYEARLAVEVADRFPMQADLFIQPVKELRAVLGSQKKTTAAGCSELDRWLGAHNGQLEARNRRVRQF
jgi:hypothetical protein